MNENENKLEEFLDRIDELKVKYRNNLVFINNLSLTSKRYLKEIENLSHDLKDYMKGIKDDKKMICRFCKKEINKCDECGIVLPDDYDDAIICSEGNHFCGLYDFGLFNGANLDCIHDYVLPEYVESKAIEIKDDKK